MKRKYIIELNHPYRDSETEPRYIYVEEASLNTDGRYLANLTFTFGRERAVSLSNRRVIRRTLNKITTSFINQEGIRRQPRPRAIRIA